MGFRGHLARAYWGCPVYRLQGAFGKRLLGMPCVWFLNGIWYGHNGVPCVRTLGGICQLPSGGALGVGFLGVFGICLMRLPCVSDTAEAVGIGVMGFSLWELICYPQRL